MNTESHFSSPVYKLPSTSWTLYKRILSTTLIYILFSATEHILSLLNNIQKMIYHISACNETNVDSVEMFIKSHIVSVTSNLPFEYNHFIGFALEYLNVSYTFFWNFLDLFIILICIGIAFLYVKINWRLQNVRGLMMSDQIWEEIRCHHVQINDLVNIVNSVIGRTIMFACLVDGYFILVQLLNITT